MAQYLDKEGLKTLWDKNLDLQVSSMNKILDNSINFSNKQLAEQAAVNNITATLTGISPTYSIRTNTLPVNTTVTITNTTTGTPNNLSLSINPSTGSGSINGNIVTINRDASITVNGSNDISKSYSYNGVKAYKVYANSDGNYKTSDGSLVLEETTSNKNKKIVVEKGNIEDVANKSINKSLSLSYTSKDNAENYYYATFATKPTISSLVVSESNNVVSLKLNNTTNMTSWNNAVSKKLTTPDKQFVVIAIKAINGNDPNKVFTFTELGSTTNITFDAHKSFIDNSVNNTIYSNYKWFIYITSASISSNAMVTVK